MRRAERIYFIRSILLFKLLKKILLRLDILDYRILKLFSPYVRIKDEYISF